MVSEQDVQQDVEGCLMTTSLKGIPRLFKARTKTMNYVWLCCTLCFLLFALYQTFKLVHSYMKYQPVTVIHEYSAQQVYQQGGGAVSEDLHGVSGLAAVTLCNNNPIPHEQHLQHVMTYDEYRENIRENIERIPVDKRHQFLENYEGPPGYYRNTPIANITEVGHQLHGFLLVCHYTLTDSAGKRTTPCRNIANIKIYSDPKFFNCFTLEVNKSQLPDKAFAYALSGIAYLDNVDEQMREMSMAGSLSEASSSGAALLFHRPGEYPDKSQALALPPGFESVVHTSQTARKRSGEPYEVCENVEGTYYDELGNTYRYSVVACMTNCMQDTIIKACDCIEPSLPVFSAPNHTKDYFFCGRLNFTNASRQMDCVFQILLSPNNCLLKCPTECREVFTVSTTSYYRWPKANYQLSLHDKLIKNTSIAHHFLEYEDIQRQLSRRNISSTEALQRLDNNFKLRNNFLKFTILANQESFSVVEDKQRLTLIELFSQIGGILNLYSGITVLIFVELLELVANMCSTAVRSPKLSASPI